MDTGPAVYEKLGVFYLGREYDLERRKVLADYVLYDSKDLVTHAVIVGMTGSGKTGLGISLLEEAAIDGIPALIIDPKGDLSNLLLQFPELRPADFAAWVHADDATRQGMTVDQFAAQEAQKWQQGLQTWDQTPDRIRRLGQAAEFTIYTPGSTAGTPLSIVASFAAPAAAIREDSDLLRDRIATMATSLLGLLGISADPLRSREHILLTNIVQHVWNEGHDLDLGSLIQWVQKPPFKQIGVMEVDSFFPAKDRFELAMTLNNLLAAPGFGAWLQGEPLDIDRLLRSPSGKPRHAIFSIAHLSDSERMFFVSLLLNQTLGWMRSRPGTTSLRALLYIDELFGYMPPVQEPPSKKPLLTLLKQARAYGLGVVLATQNPVDLDYKGLSNMGTWFLGRLQTERDKERMLDGLEGASTEAGDHFDRSSMSDLLSQLGQRVFLMHNVHEDRPVVFQTRWALSYLTGPMTRNQIRQLTESRPRPELPPHAPASAIPSSAPLNVHDVARTRPVLPAEVPQVFLPASRPTYDNTVLYEPYLVGFATVHFVDTRKGLAANESVALITPLAESATTVDWSASKALRLTADDLPSDPLPDAGFASLPTTSNLAKNIATWSKRFAEHLYRSRTFDLYRSAHLDQCSTPGEAERDFRIRLVEAAREARDRELEQLRKKYANKVRTLTERVQRAEATVDKELQEASSSKLQTVISFGATVLGAVLGRKTMSSTNIGRATTTARGMGRVTKETDDIRRAESKLADCRQQLDELEAEINAEADRIRTDLDPLSEPLETIQLKPRKSDIDVRLVALAWLPGQLDAHGQFRSLYVDASE